MAMAQSISSSLPPGQVIETVLVSMSMLSIWHPIREVTIDGNGMHIGKAFCNVTGILAGNPVHVTPGELERMEGLFQPEESSAC